MRSIMLLSMGGYLSLAEVIPGRTPPMGWSSWYAFGPGVDQSHMEATFRKLVNRTVSQHQNKSLHDVGYVFANIDDGWQACNAGINGSFHSATGEPLVNATRFPDVAAMTRLAHDLGLRPGFYFNNYICGEGMPWGGEGGLAYRRNMQGSVDFLARNNFSYVKIDSGSVYNNMQLWHDLIEASGHAMVVENCHQGHLEPNATWCPFTLFRTSGDLHVVGLDVELLATAAVLNQSRPYCWAHPDTIDPGSPQQVRTQFAAYSIMSAPLVLSFDILNDAKLVPIWDILTNEEAIRVNQQWAGSAGMLLRKWAPHLASEPLFPWAEHCNASDPTQHGWAYNNGTGTVSWTPPTGEPLCMSTASGILGLDACKNGSQQQKWVFKNGRLWQGGSLQAGAPAGVLRLKNCSTAAPGQRWKLSGAPGSGVQTSVQNDLPFRTGGCWEITACETGDGAEVGVNFGCKTLPGPGWTNLCDANGAWLFNTNGTITSVMDGKCLQVNPLDNRTVDVVRCNGTESQRWKVHGRSIESAAHLGKCIDSGITAPPPGTTGRCATLQLTNDIGGAGSWAGLQGPALWLADGPDCVPDVKPPAQQAFAFDSHESLKASNLCLAGRHGQPTPFGPLQLWAKPQPQGAVAIVLLNRAGSGAANVTVDVELHELPGLSLGPSGRAQVRDIWEHRDLEAVGSVLSVSVPAGDSRFLYLSAQRTPVLVF